MMAVRKDSGSVPAAAIVIKRRSMFGEAASRLVRNKVAMAGLSMFTLVVVLTVLAGVICPEGYDAQNIGNRFIPPGRSFLFGTDNLGRSMLARLLYGGRLSLLIGIVSTSISATVGIALGAVAGYLGGRADHLIMRLLEVFNSIPSLLMAIAISAALGTGLLNAMLAVGISAVPVFARIVRGPVLTVRDQEYIEAARSINASHWRVIVKHVLPNVLSPIIVQITMSMAMAILIAASLSFLGLGVQAPVPEWGALVAASRQYVRQYPYLVTFPGLAIATVVLSLNLFGDGLRDALDPRLKY